MLILASAVAHNSSLYFIKFNCFWKKCCYISGSVAIFTFSGSNCFTFVNRSWFINCSFEKASLSNSSALFSAAIFHFLSLCCIQQLISISLTAALFLHGSVIIFVNKRVECIELPVGCCNSTSSM